MEGGEGRGEIRSISDRGGFLGPAKRWGVDADLNGEKARHCHVKTWSVNADLNSENE